MNAPEPVQMEPINVQVPSVLKARLEEFAARHKRSLSAEVRRAIRQYLDQESNGEAA